MGFGSTGRRGSTHKKALVGWKLLLRIGGRLGHNVYRTLSWINQEPTEKHKAQRKAGLPEFEAGAVRWHGPKAHIGRGPLLHTRALAA